MDQDNQRDRGRTRQIQQSPSSSYDIHPKTNICQGKEKFGINIDKDNNITYREWAPNATQAFFIGEFSITSRPFGNSGFVVLN